MTREVTRGVTGEVTREVTGEVTGEVTRGVTGGVTGEVTVDWTELLELQQTIIADTRFRRYVYHLPYLRPL